MTRRSGAVTVPVSAVLERQRGGVLARLAADWIHQPTPCHPSCRLEQLVLTDQGGRLAVAGIASCGHRWALLPPN